MSADKERDLTETELQTMKHADLRKLIREMWVNTGLGTLGEVNKLLRDDSTYADLDEDEDEDAYLEARRKHWIGLYMQAKGKIRWDEGTDDRQSEWFARREQLRREELETLSDEDLLVETRILGEDVLREWWSPPEDETCNVIWGHREREAQNTFLTSCILTPTDEEKGVSGSCRAEGPGSCEYSAARHSIKWQSWPGRILLRLKSSSSKCL